MKTTKFYFLMSILLLAVLASPVEGGELIIETESMDGTVGGTAGDTDDNAPGLWSGGRGDNLDRHHVGGEIIYLFSDYMAVERIAVPGLGDLDEAPQIFVRGLLQPTRFPTCDPCETPWIEVSQPDAQTLRFQMIERTLPPQVSGQTPSVWYVSLELIELTSRTVDALERVWVDTPVGFD